MKTIEQIIEEQKNYEVDHFESYKPNYVYQCTYHQLENITFWGYRWNSDSFFADENTVGVWRIKYKNDAQ